MQTIPDQAGNRLTFLKKRADFLRLREGVRVHSNLFSLQMRETPVAQCLLGASRLGITVTKKTGIATERNRMKRRLREAAKLVFPGKARAGFDYCIIARRGVLTSEFKTIQSELLTSLDRAHKKKAKGR